MTDMELLDRQISNARDALRDAKGALASLEQQRREIKDGSRPSLEITYSLDQKLYYVSTSHYGVHIPRYWLSVDHIAEPTEEEKRGDRDVFGPAFLVVTPKGGNPYWRAAYGFSFFQIKAGRRETATIGSDLVKDYASLHDWHIG